MMAGIAGRAIRAVITWPVVAGCGWATVAIGSQLGFQLGCRPVDDGLAAVVVIERRACPYCRGERPGRAEVLIDARRPAGARPDQAAVAGLVHPEDLWQLCRNELTRAEVRIGGSNIRRRWFGVVNGSVGRW